MIKSNESNKSEIVSSIPIGRIGMHTNSSEAFFKLDEELNPDFISPKNNYPISYSDDVEFESDDAGIGPRRFTVGSPIDPEEGGMDIQKTPNRLEVAASVPIDISMPNSHASYNVDEEELIPINKLETRLNKQNANPDEVAEAFSLRDQTMFRNIQLLSLSVQPDDCPERLFGIRDASPHESGTSKIAPQTYAPGAINIPHNQNLTNSPASIHTPKEPAKVMRPPAHQSKQVVIVTKGDQLPKLPHM